MIKRIINTIKIKNGEFITIGEYRFGGNYMTKVQKDWLIKNKVILSDNNIIKKLLDKIFIDIKMRKGDFNGEGNT